MSISIKDNSKTEQIEHPGNTVSQCCLSFAEDMVNVAKREFLSRVSHEMLTPMNAIMGMAQIAMNEEPSDKVKECIAEIDKASRQLLGLIHGLLDVTDRTDSTPGHIDVVFSLNTLLCEISKKIPTYAPEKQQTINYNIDPLIPILLYGNKNGLTQVISHLMDNAVKFTPEYGSIHFSARQLCRENGIVTMQMEVTDNGTGISKELHDAIFSIFGQADENISQKYGGVGLGLPLSKRIIEMMDGKIWVESEPDKGAKFAFTCKLRHISHDN